MQNIDNARAQRLCDKARRRALRMMREDGFLGSASVLRKPARDGIVHSFQVRTRVNDRVLGVTAGVEVLFGAWVPEFAFVWHATKYTPEILNTMNCHIVRPVIDDREGGNVSWFELADAPDATLERLDAAIRRTASEFAYHFSEHAAMLEYWEEHRDFPGPFGGAWHGAAYAARLVALGGDERRAREIMSDAITDAQTRFPTVVGWLRDRLDRVAGSVK